MKRIAWCNTYYKNSFAKQKAEELRKLGYNVQLGNYLRENNETYCKIYLMIDFDYHVLTTLETIKTNVKYGKKDIIESINTVKNKIKDLCKEYQQPLRLEYENSTNTLFAVSNNKEFSIYLN